ncbi:MAG: hypothetical protein GY755_09170 [Chloroflexi bacterium]|nr:hypothetical protein [Chloroflexota bacterium]
MSKEVEPKSTPPAEKQSLLFQVVTFPKHIGQLVFEIIRYSDAADYAKMMVGYGLIAVIVLLLLGILAPDILKSFSAFLFPK